jgi:hypothetical protein
MLVGANNNKTLFADANPAMDESFFTPDIVAKSDGVVEFMILNTRGKAVYAITSAAEPVLEAEVVVRRGGGLSSFSLTILNNTDFIGSVGSVVSIVINGSWLGYGVIDTMVIKDNLREIGGGNFLQALYDVELETLPRASDTPARIAEALTLEALSKFNAGNYEGLLNGVGEASYVGAPNPLPSFDTKEITLGEALETLAELAGGAYYGINEEGFLYFTDPLYAAPIRLTEDYDYYDLKIDTDKKAVRNAVKVLLAENGSGNILDFGDKAVAEDANSIVKYGRQYKEVTVPFYLHSTLETAQMARFFIVPEAPYKGSLAFTQNRYVALSRYIVSRKVNEEKALLNACKNINDFTAAGVIVDDDYVNYALGTKAYSFTAAEAEASVTVAVTVSALSQLRIMMCCTEPVYIYGGGRLLAAIEPLPLLCEVVIETPPIIDELKFVMTHGGTLTVDHISGVNNFYEDAVVDLYEAVYVIKGETVESRMSFGKEGADAVSLIKDLGKQAALVYSIIRKGVNS